MVEILGTTINTPSIDISGFISSSWIYIALIAVVGFILIAGIAILLFFNTYNRKIVLFENVSGMGYQPTIRTRARIVKIGKSGVEVLKTMKGGEIISAYGRKMGKNSYWFGKAQDGYWYNIVLGDLDAKLGMLDIEPVDRDVRMFHAARNRLTDATYGEKKNWIEKYAPSMILLLTVVVLMVGLYIVAGKINEGQMATAEAALINKETMTLANGVLTKIDSIQRGGESGIVQSTSIVEDG